MNKCIYNCTGSDNLTYKSQEHVIPAGLGGIAKLPKGCVSDQVNEEFSKIELKGLRSSLLTGNRLRHGPGKRGNLNVKREKSPLIRILKEEIGDNHLYRLGYLFNGQSYVLAQASCIYDIVTGNMNIGYLGDTFDITDYKIYLSNFRKEFMSFLVNPNRSYIKVENNFKTVNNILNIGFHNEKWYLSTNIPFFDINNFAMNIIVSAINGSKKFRRYNFDPINIEPKKTHFRYRHPVDITDNSFTFLFVKTAFNGLAYLLGQEIALSNIFDNIRRDILEYKNLESYIKPNSLKEIFEEHIEILPENAHCIYLVSKENVIYAYVSFYNEWHAYLILTEVYSGEKLIVGYICDWKSKKEYHFT